MIVTNLCTKLNSCNSCKIVHPVFTCSIRMSPVNNLENYLLIKLIMWARIAVLMLHDLHRYRSLVTVKTIMAMIPVYTCLNVLTSLNPNNQVKSCT